MSNYIIKTQEKKNESDYQNDSYDPEIDENNFDILYNNLQKARYVIHHNYPHFIRFDEEHLYVDSDEYNASLEEESG
jgi:hypothetical protein